MRIINKVKAKVIDYRPEREEGFLVMLRDNYLGDGWVTGYYVDGHVVGDIEEKIGGMIGFSYCEEVEKDSVRQSIGQKDREGKDIYCGDYVYIEKARERSGYTPKDFPKYIDMIGRVEYSVELARYRIQELKPVSEHKEIFCYKVDEDKVIEDETIYHSRYEIMRNDFPAASFHNNLRVLRDDEVKEYLGDAEERLTRGQRVMGRL